MNKTELQAFLSEIWAQDNSLEKSFICGHNSKGLSAQKLIQILEHPQVISPRYTHPQLNRELVLIQKLDPVSILTSIFQAWGQGDDALILDPHLSLEQTQKQLKGWGFTASSSHIQASSSGPLSIALATSGSSGNPKLIGLSAAHMNSSTQMTRDFLGESFPCSWGLSLPCWHIGGLMVLWRMLVTRGRVIEVDLKKDLAENEPYKFQALSLVPTQLQRLIDQNQSSQLSQLSLILLGGAACPARLVKESLQLKLPLCLSYGSTETCSLIAASRPSCEQQTQKLHALSGVQLKTTSEQKLQISSPSLHAWRIEGHKLITQSPNSFYTTQDRAQINEKMELELLGRTDRTFISGGENVSAEMIENIAAECPLVRQAQILIRPDRVYGQVSHLYYRPQNKARPDIEFQIMEFLKKQLRGFELPKSLSLMPEYTSLKPPRSKWQEQILQQYEEFKDQPAFIFLHGFMGVPDEFLMLKNALLKKGIPAWKIKALRLPGHDGLRISEESSMADSLSIFNSELKHHLQTPHILYAYSMGARVFSMWLYDCAQASELENIKGLILESAHPGGLSGNEAQKRAEFDAQIFNPQTVKLESFLKKWSELPLFEGLAQLDITSQLSKIKTARHDPQQLYASLQSLSVSQQPEVQETWDQLSQVCPVIYLSGPKDLKYTKIGQGLKIAHKIHPWASHNIHLQDPEWCAKCVVETLEKSQKLK